MGVFNVINEKGNADAIVAAVSRCLNTATDERVRARGVRTLALLKIVTRNFDMMVAAVFRSLQDPDPIVREAALEVIVEIAKDVKVKVQRSLISGVQSKGDPVTGGAANENANQKSGGSVLGKLFGMGGGQQQTTVNNNEAPQPASPEEPASQPEAAEEPMTKDGDNNHGKN